MIEHLFKLIWNKKKQNFLLITEMFVSFIVMFAVFTLMVYYFQNYRKPNTYPIPLSDHKTAIRCEKI